jgi:lysophospholipase L1-like esterase
MTLTAKAGAPAQIKPLQPTAMRYITFLLLFLVSGVLPAAAAGPAPDSVVVINAGRNGNNTANLLRRVQRDVLQQSPDVVVMMAGTNDMFNPSNHLPMDRFRKNYQKLIGMLKKHATVILMTIPPEYAPYIIKRKPQFGFAADGPRRRVDSANAVIRQLAARNHLPLLDMHRIFSACGGATADVHSLFQNEANFGIPDGVHPTREGSRVMAVAVYQEIRLLKPGARKIVCFGDSITRGYRLKGEGTTRGDTYPAVLRRLFNRDGN